MLNDVITKIQHKLDVIAGGAVSVGLTTTPVWVEGLTTWLQVITLVVGIAVGVSAYRLNTIKRKKLERSNDNGKGN